MDPLVIILQTYQRTSYALRTIRAMAEWLQCGRPHVWLLADDGSPAAHVDALLASLEAFGQTVADVYSARSSYGSCANAAWERATQIGPITLWLEDDWELHAPLALDAHIHTLTEQESVGMVRLGYLAIGYTARTESLSGSLYWRLARRPWLDGTPIFTGHPSLRHVRYRDAYGPYPEGLNPGATELAYAWQHISAAHGPDILWPAELAQWGVFDHIGAEKSYQ